MPRKPKSELAMRFSVKSIGPDDHVNTSASEATTTIVMTPNTAILVASHLLRVTLCVQTIR